MWYVGIVLTDISFVVTPINSLYDRFKMEVHSVSPVADMQL